MSLTNDAIASHEVMILSNKETFGFGVSMTDYQQVYIPSSIVRNFEMLEGAVYNMKLLPNNHDPKGTTPWFAVFAEVNTVKPSVEQVQAEIAAEPEPAPVVRITKNDCFELLQNFQVPMSTAAVAEMLEVEDTALVGALLNNLYVAGKVHRMSVHHKDNNRASLNYWAIDLPTIREFMEFE